MTDVLKVSFPQGKIYVKNDGQGQAYIEYNKEYVKKFNKDLNQTQVYLDNTVIRYLMELFVKYS